MKISVSVRTVYGNKTYYPECERSHILCGMMKQMTLTSKNIADLKRMGVEIENVTKPEEI